MSLLHYTRFTRLFLHQQYRLFSSSSPRLHLTATEAASQMMKMLSDRTTTRHQILDANQLHKLSITLLNNTPTPPRNGSPIPPGHHLVYFTPSDVESSLGLDGSDQAFNAPSPFSRRMWAGGNMAWFSDVDLCVDDQVEEKTRLVSAVPKISRSAGEMVLVEVEKEFWGPKGLGLVDRRSWVFRPPSEDVGGNGAMRVLEDVTRGPSIVEDLPVDESGYPARQLRWSAAGLFRFSALTFNSHMVHYNEPWTREVEGHPGVVVHGPLNLVNILDYWRNIHGKGMKPTRIGYRATAPVYAGQTYYIRTVGVRTGHDGIVTDIVAEKDGTTLMRAEVVG